VTADPGTAAETTPTTWAANATTQERPLAEATPGLAATPTAAAADVLLALPLACVATAEPVALGATPILEAFTAAHLERLQRIAQRPSQPAPGGRRRGLAAQQVLRELEQSIRLGVVDFCQQATTQGLSRTATAALLNLAPRTLRFWEHAQRHGTLGVRPRGRPLTAAEPDQLDAVVALLHRLGPATGLAVLQGEFPELARAELQDLLACYRDAWQGQHRRLLHVLHWPQPGRVWAMDHAQAPCWIDGCYRYVLAVRDLASGQQLLWLPVAAATAASTVAALAWLFACHGAPLVLKSDNGSAFCAEQTQQFLHSQGVQALFSPPRTPAYNGSCEAAIGSLKKRTAAAAERQGHEQEWTSDDLEQARENANTTARPRGPRGATPDEAWQQRTPISIAERHGFAQTVRGLRSQVRQAWGWPADQELARREEAVLQREVLRRALVEHGYLLFTRRRIPIPIRRTKAAKIM
jgi:transposase InsO family protein